MKLDTTTQRIGMVSIGAVVLVAIVWYLVLWSPQSKDLHAAHAARASAESTASTLQQQISSLEVLVGDVKSDTGKLKTYDAAIPNNPQLPAALNQLQEVADQTGVTMTNIGSGAAPTTTSGTPTTFNGIPALNVSLSVTGTYPQLMALINALDNMPRTVVLTTLNLGSGTNGDLSGTLTGYVFYAGQPTP